jgi:hypothetical protein
MKRMRSKKWVILAIAMAILLGSAFLVVGDLTGWAMKTTAVPVYPPVSTFDKYRPVAILGEARPTSFTERWFRFKEDNLQFRSQLFDLLKRENPGLLVFLGDQVNRGSSIRDWQLFDQVTNYFTSNKIPVLGIVGEREYAGFSGRGQDHARARFSILKEKNWSMMIYLNLAFIFLDSNSASLSTAQWNEQKEWFRTTLQQLDGHKAVDGILVFLHHPPFTNAKSNSTDARVRETFLDSFYESRKSMLMISGHVGAFEKFHEREKYFLVTGGAGGPRSDLAQGEDRPYNDLYKGPAPRPFHYLLLMSVQGGITYEVKGFDRGEPNIRQLEKSFVPFR